MSHTPPPCPHAHRPSPASPNCSRGTGPAGQDQEADITDYNNPPAGQPGLWCQWVPTDDGTAIEWDGGEKFYHPVEWLQYLIDTFLKPGAVVLVELRNPVPDRHYPPEFEQFTFDHVVAGRIEAEGEYGDDEWALVVDQNHVERVDASGVEDSVGVYPDMVEDYCPGEPVSWYTSSTCRSGQPIPGMGGCRMAKHE